MTNEPIETEADRDDGPSALMKALAAVMLVIPLAGIAWHVYVSLALDDEAVSAYLRSLWLKALALVAFFNLLGNWFHYRHTRMKVDLASRILTYVWVISMVLLFRRVVNW